MYVIKLVLCVYDVLFECLFLGSNYSAINKHRIHSFSKGE